MMKLMSKGFMFPSSSDCGEIYHHRPLNLPGICSFPNKSVNLSCLPSLNLSSSCLPRTDFYGRRLVINEGVSKFNRRNSQAVDITAQVCFFFVFEGLLLKILNMSSLDHICFHDFGVKSNFVEYCSFA